MAKHIVELRDLVAAALRDRRLFKIAVAAHVLNDALTIELFFQAAQRSLNGLALADFYFNCHNFRERGVPRRQSKPSSILFRACYWFIGESLASRSFPNHPSPTDTGHPLRLKPSPSLSSFASDHPFAFRPNYSIHSDLRPN